MYAKVRDGGVQAILTRIPPEFRGLDAAGLRAKGIYPLVDVTPAGEGGFYRQVGAPQYTVTPVAVELLRVMAKVEVVEAKQRRLDQIEERLVERASRGLVVGGQEWDASPENRNALVAVLTLLNSGASLPSGFTWRTKDGVAVALTEAQLRALAQAVIVALYRAHEWAAAKREQVLAAGTTDDVIAVDLRT
jgi:hypothetical protein